MTRLHNYLSEYKIPRSTSLTKEEATDLIHTKCKKILKLYKNTELRIIRGTSNHGSFALTDPSKGEPRRSANTMNYVTLLVDHILPSWKDYPKRSKSLICSTIDGRTFYGSTTYVIFPYDKGKIGESTRRDWWISFPNLKASIPNLNYALEKISNYIGIPLSETDPKKLERLLQKVDYDDVINATPLHVSTLTNFRTGSFLEFLDDLLSPRNNNFKLKKSGQNLLKNVEVWTDSKCVLVDMMNKLLQDILI